MTIIDVISRSLNDLKQPSTYREIYEHIVEKQYYDFGAKSPESVVRVKLRLHCDNVNIKSGQGKKKFFHSHGGQGVSERFSLLETPIPKQTNRNKTASINKNQTIVKKVGWFKKLISWFNKKDFSIHKSACIECFWMLTGSFLPILLDSFLRKSLMGIGFIDAMKQNLKSGEVFLLTSALIMPFFFIMINYMRSDEETKKINQLPYFGWMFFVTLGSLIMGTFTFLYYRIGQIVRKEAESDIVKSMFSFDFGNWAIFIFIVSLIVWYYSSYMNHRSTEHFKKIRKEQQDKLENDFNSTVEKQV